MRQMRYTWRATHLAGNIYDTDEIHLAGHMHLAGNIYETDEMHLACNVLGSR